MRTLGYRAPGRYSITSAIGILSVYALILIAVTVVSLLSACAEQPLEVSDYKRMHPNEPTPGSMRDLGAGVSAIGQGFQNRAISYDPQLARQSQQQQFEARQQEQFGTLPTYSPPAYSRPTHCTTYQVGTGNWATLQTDCY